MRQKLSALLSLFCLAVLWSLAGVVLAADNTATSTPTATSQISQQQETTTADEKGGPYGKTWREPTTGMEFIWIEGGCFQMGCEADRPQEKKSLAMLPESFSEIKAWQWPLAMLALALPVSCASPDYYQRTGCFKEEQPVHEVCVNGFYIGKYEVTQGEYRKIIESNPSHFRGNDYPMEKVSWLGSQIFIHHLNKESGKRFRLPTEAEWEYAARSGGRNEKYAGSDSIRSVAWYAANSNGSTQRVGSKSPNGLGLYDMSGNVWEWCSDYFNKDYYTSSPKNNPKGPAEGRERVARGGSWAFEAPYARTAFRFRYRPESHYASIGFRLVLAE